MGWPRDNEPHRAPPKLQPMEEENRGWLRWWIFIGICLAIFWGIVIWLVT